MIDPQSFPRHGDLSGEPLHGHRVDVIHAAVAVFADGTEGLFSSYAFNAGGQPTGRVTFVSSDPKVIEQMKRMTAQLEPPPGGRIEWREYRR